MNSVRNFGAKGNYDLQNRTGDDDTNAFLEAAALGEPVYVPNGVYKISAPIRIKGIIRGEDVRKTRIVQTDANESALEIGGDACLVSELTIQHEQNKQSVSNPWGGAGIRIVGRLRDRSVIERCLLLNNRFGIYCHEPGTGWDSTTFYSIQIRDMRIARFSKSGIFLKPWGKAYATGCVFTNIYFVNWDDFEKGTKTLADQAMHIEQCAELELIQMNVEHGRYLRGLSFKNVRQISLNGFHVEGYVAEGKNNALIDVHGSSSNHLTATNTTVVFNNFENAALEKFAYLNASVPYAVNIQGLVCDKNKLSTKKGLLFRTSATNRKESKMSLFGYVPQKGLFENPQEPGPELPVIWEVNGNKTRWQEGGFERVYLSEKPTGGSWKAGDTVFNAFFNGSNVRAWLCLESGLTREWKELY